MDAQSMLQFHALAWSFLSYSTNITQGRYLVGNRAQPYIPFGFHYLTTNPKYNDSEAIHSLEFKLWAFLCLIGCLRNWGHWRSYSVASASARQVRGSCVCDSPQRKGPSDDDTNLKCFLLFTSHHSRVSFPFLFPVCHAQIQSCATIEISS